MTSPVFPLLAPTSLIMSTWPEPPRTLPASLLNIGSGFEKLDLTEGFTDMFQIIRFIEMTTIGLEMYSTLHSAAPKLSRIVVARNQITHDLLSLPSELDCRHQYNTTSAESNTSGALALRQALYNLLRLSTLAFDLLVLFPLPLCSGIHSALAEQLGAALEDCNLLNLWNLHTEFVLWSIIIGGAISRGLKTEPYFAGLARKACTKLPNSSPKIHKAQTSSNSSKTASTSRAHTSLQWEKCRDICYRFLWYSGPECNGQGRAFWVDNMNTPGL
jgi:hypothetical protein